MKVKRNRRSEILQTTTGTSEESTDTSNNGIKKSIQRRSVGLRSERRRSLGPLRGLSLSLRSRGTDSSNHSSDSSSATDDKSSLLKRFGLRRSAKKSNKAGINKTEPRTRTDVRLSSKSSNINNDDKLQTLQNCAGHTPKSQRIQRVDSAKVQEMLSHSPWDSGDSDCDDYIVRRSIRKVNSLKGKGRKLKRSMSLLCGGSRSKHVKVDCAPVSKGRRSVDGDLIVAVKNSRKERLESSLCSVEEKKEGSLHSPISLDFNIKSSDSDTPRHFNAYTPLLESGKKGSAKRRSDTGMVLSGKKWKVRRESYTKMNHDRDRASPVLQKRTDDTENSQTPTRNRRSLKRNWSSIKLAAKSDNIENNIPKHTAEPPRRSLRRKSLGVVGSPADRRGSGIYASSAHTPTFMTCGYVMTDSPPDRPDYNSNSLPWVTMKRKHRSDAADKARVNRYNAGHTPLPARKKQRTYGERLIE